ncbi:50S ribosomal protein L18 [bacterium]|nr:MAG: 50S ribosomal protein L18 [bacterium]QQR62029.1 MAG: 50S ribosomal protein L18 [bacterium]QQR62376.1 MAG: 50S ribosomal protein L18 [bacterium]
MITHKKDRIRKLRRKLSVRARCKKGTADYPRISVFRSLNHIYAQMIDDVQGITLASCSTVAIDLENGDKKHQAYQVGLTLAKLASQKGIARAFLDRGSARYTGRVASLTDGLRKGGLGI